MNVAMHTLRLVLFRLLSLALAGLVLAWAGAAAASEAFDSAYELVEQVGEEPERAFNLDTGVDDPQDCPAFVSGFALAAPALDECRREAPQPRFRSLLPHPNAPPPRLG